MHVYMYIYSGPKNIWLFLYSVWFKSVMNCSCGYSTEHDLHIHQVLKSTCKLKEVLEKLQHHTSRDATWLKKKKKVLVTLTATRANFFVDYFKMKTRHPNDCYIRCTFVRTDKDQQNKHCCHAFSYFSIEQQSSNKVYSC